MVIQFPIKTAKDSTCTVTRIHVESQIIRMDPLVPLDLM